MSYNKNQLYSTGILPQMKSGISNNILNDEYFEYKLLIDGNDRNTDLYRQPFQFRVELSETTNRRPNINKSFKNVKAFRLDRVILPRVTSVNLDFIYTDNQIYPMGACADIAEAPPCCTPASNVSSETLETSLALTNCLQILANQRYLLLRIEELSTPTMLGTNTYLDNNIIPIVYYQDAGNDSCIWIPYDESGTLKYKSSQLQNFKSLTISLLYSDGSPVVLLDPRDNPIVGKQYTIYSDIVDGEVVNYDYVAYTNKYIGKYNQSISNNATTYTWGVMRMNVFCTLFVKENEIDTNTNYS